MWLGQIIIVEVRMVYNETLEGKKNQEVERG